MCNSAPETKKKPMQWSRCLAEEQYCLTGLGDPQESSVKADCPLGDIRKSVAGRLKVHFWVALGTTSDILCLVLVFLVQDMLIHEGCHDDEGVEAHDVQRRLSAGFIPS